MGLVRMIVTKPDIWERFSDGVDAETFFPSTTAANQWILVMEETDIIGVIYLHCDTSCSIGFHPYLLSKHRVKGREMMKVFFNWFLENIPESIVKINVVIPDCFKSAVNFAKKVGFKLEGISRESYTQEDKICDRIMLGITRSEVQKWAA